MPHDRNLPGLIAALTARTPLETLQLVATLSDGCWPGGSEDRTAPFARDWLSRWGPRGLPPAPLACACARGSCTVCN